MSVVHEFLSGNAQTICVGLFGRNRGETDDT